MGPATVLLAALLLTGCLPSSCNPRQSRALFPADSLSRNIAATTPVDTLQFVRRTDLDAAGVEHPRTVAFGPGGGLYVSDTEQHRIYRFSGSPTPDVITSEGFRHPYLMGFRRDTLLVYNPLVRRVDFVSGGAVRRSLTFEGEPPSDEALEYAAASDSLYYLKLLAEDAPGYIARYDAQGRETGRTALPGPHWRYAGFLRLWGDSLVSLSGYRPLVHLWAPGEPLDTLALQGFDSPMLNRTRLYMLGQADDAPLLSTSAAAVGDRLFVINLRPGWLQVDVYDRSGRLRHILTQPGGGQLGEFMPVDLAVRRANGGYDLAVLTASPNALWLYRWNGYN